MVSARSLAIALAPDLLTAVVRSGEHIVAHSAVRIPVDYPHGHWQSALSAFAGYLRNAGIALRGAPVSVSLTTRWCQLAMLPWSEALLQADSARRFQEAQFVALYGQVARNWAFVCDEAPYGQPRLACAVERAFLEGLQTIAHECGHPCGVVESVLSNAWRSIAANNVEAFALVEPGRLVLAAAAQGRIVGVQAGALRGPWHSEMPSGWQRWTMCAPEIGDIAQVALVDLGSRRAQGRGDVRRSA